MEKIDSIEKFKGEIDGKFAKVYIATDQKMNRFATQDLKFNQEGESIKIDIKATQWNPIDQPQYRDYQKNLYSLGISKIQEKTRNEEVNPKSDNIKVTNQTQDQLRDNYLKLNEDEINRYARLMQYRQNQLT